MKHRLLLLIAAFSLSANPQAWSTFLDRSRAIDWYNTGFTIPNYTVDCPIQPSLRANDPNAGAANTAAIEAALASCDATHNVVNIPAGRYYVAGWKYGAQGKQVVRGAGPVSTTIVVTTTRACAGWLWGVCMTPATGQNWNTSAVLPPNGTQQCLWTGGYTQGSTTVTLSSCPGGPPPVGSIMVLDQANDTSDTGGVYNCDMTTAGTYGTPCEGYNVPTTANGTAGQNQITIASANPSPVNLLGLAVGSTVVTVDESAGFDLPTKVAAINGTTITLNKNLTTTLTNKAVQFQVPHNNANGRVISENTYSEKQVVRVQSVSGSSSRPYTVGISKPIFFKNIRAEQTPGAWWYTSAATTQLDGLENITIDHSYSTQNTPVGIENCYHCWGRNTRQIQGVRSNIVIYTSLDNVIRDNYFYGVQRNGPQSYGVEIEGASGLLVENNIFQQTTAPVMFGNGAGNVIAYNYTIGNIYSGTGMQFSYYAHNSGNEMNLWEGNNLNGINCDGSTFGPSGSGTLFRNVLIGWQSGKTFPFDPIILGYGCRGVNIVGNVLGQRGIHTQYESYATSASRGVGGIPNPNYNTTIYSLGWNGISGFQNGAFHSGNGDCGALTPPCDPLDRSTLMRWGNWDVVTNGTRWDSTEASPAAVPYISANFTPSYFSSLSHTLPASLHYSSVPPWWPTEKAWPPVGPDVSSGNLGVCSGGSYAGAQGTGANQCTGGTFATQYAGHANSIPAQDCYLNAMSGPPDGSGSVLNFDASRCYASYQISTAAPTGLTVTVH